MSSIRTIICLLLALGTMHPTAAPAAGRDQMPIIAYMGVPDWQTSDENFRTLSECGFTVSLYPYATLDLMVKACRLADKYGVKILGQCPEMIKEPSRAALVLRQEPGFFGYMMQDEPSVPEIRQRQAEIEQLMRYDNQHPFYINLLPYYNPDWIEPRTKVKTYQEYLHAAATTSCQQLSFDFYPVTSQGIRNTWHENLEMVRNECIASGKPFWGFVLSVPHENTAYPSAPYYPVPTQASLRLQVYTNLAYGAQAIQYFTYWTPGKDPEFHYHNGPVDNDGKKTKTYGLVQQMNKELQSVAQLFYGAKVTSVCHLGVIENGTTRATQMPVNIKSLKIAGKKGAILSQLEKDGHTYLAIVNKDHENAMQLHIKVRNAVPKRITKTFMAEKPKPTYTIEAGDIVLMRLK